MPLQWCQTQIRGTRTIPQGTFDTLGSSLNVMALRACIHTMCSVCHPTLHRVASDCRVLDSSFVLREIPTIAKGRKPPTRTALCVLSHRTITIYTHDPFDTLRTHRGTCPAARTSRSTSTPPRDITAARTRDHMRFSGHARGLTREMRLTYHSDLVLLWVLGEFHAPTRPLTTTLSSSRSRASTTPARPCRRTRCSHPCALSRWPHCHTSVWCRLHT